MDGYFYNNLIAMKEKTRENMDFPIVFDGRERSGKTTLAHQAACVVDPTYTLDRTCFTAKQFKEAVLSAQKYQAVVLDEGYGALASRNAMTQTNKAIVKMLTEVGMKNLFLFIVLPSIFDLDRYVSMWRSHALVHVRFTDDLRRGAFSFYAYDRKKQLLIQGKPTYSYQCVKPNFFGSFSGTFPLDEQVYEAKKIEAITSSKDSAEKVSAPRIQRDHLIKHLHFNCNLTPHEIEKLLAECEEDMEYFNICRVLRER